MYADIGKKKCGIVIANVAFCIISPPKVYNANNCLKFTESKYRPNVG